MAVAVQTGPSRGTRVKIVAAFLAIYLIWGTTFLGIRIAVETGTEALADIRWSFWKTLDDDAAEEYEAEFNRAVAKRFPRFGFEIENR